MNNTLRRGLEDIHLISIQPKLNNSKTEAIQSLKDKIDKDMRQKDSNKINQTFQGKK